MRHSDFASNPVKAPFDYYVFCIQQSVQEEALAGYCALALNCNDCLCRSGVDWREIVTHGRPSFFAILWHSIRSLLISQHPILWSSVRPRKEEAHYYYSAPVAVLLHGRMVTWNCPHCIPAWPSIHASRATEKWVQQWVTSRQSFNRRHHRLLGPVHILHCCWYLLSGI